jgi:hypothetical protein
MTFDGSTETCEWAVCRFGRLSGLWALSRSSL